MNLLSIHLLGNVRASHDDWASQITMTRSTQALLAYLILQRSFLHSREVLAGLFWGDSSDESARRCLSTTLWRLRRVLEPEGIPRGTYLVASSSGEVGFNCESAYWLDVEVLEASSRRMLTQSAFDLHTAHVRELESTLRLYTGELLQGFYHDWVLRERERVRTIYLNSLNFLMKYYKGQGEYEQSLDCGQRILDQDPLREDIHREMMRLHVESGHRGLAIRQYETCRKVLQDELGVPPMKETQALYDQIVLATDGNAAQPTIKAEKTHLENLLRELNIAMQSLEDTRKQLQRVTRDVESYLKNTSQ